MTKQDELAKLERLADEGKLSRDGALYEALVACIENQGDYKITPEILKLLDKEPDKVEHPFDGTDEGGPPKP